MPQRQDDAQPRTLEVRVGRVRRLQGVLTAYGKEPAAGPVLAGPEGLAGDEVGDRANHGGRDKAIYVYSADHDPFWKAELPHHRDRLGVGAFGENLAVSGLAEDDVWVGDCWRVGSALLQPCQPRHPCATMARWFDDPLIVKAFHRAGRSGWYCRVLEPGPIAPGDPWRLEHRPAEGWSVRRLIDATATRPIDADSAQAARALPGLAHEWRNWIDG